MALTPKQEKFCQCVVSGMSYSDAYKSAYDTNTTDNAIYTESSRLALRDDIQDRILALRKPLEKAAQAQVMTARQKQIEFITERIRICQEKEDENSLIRWSDQLNKILALYKETETEQKQSNSVDNLDTDTLKKLSGIA